MFYGQFVLVLPQIIHVEKGFVFFREAAKKFYFSGPATKRVGGKGRATKKNNLSKNFF